MEDWTPQKSENESLTSIVVVFNKMHANKVTFASFTLSPLIGNQFFFSNNDLIKYRPFFCKKSSEAWMNASRTIQYKVEICSHWKGLHRWFNLSDYKKIIEVRTYCDIILKSNETNLKMLHSINVCYVKCFYVRE